MAIQPETNVAEESAADSPVTNLTAGPGTVLGFRYDLYDGSANRIESHREGDPVLVLFGEPSMLVALQDAFLGKKTLSGTNTANFQKAIQGWQDASLPGR